MSALQDIVTAVTFSSDGSTALKYKKGPHSTGDGDRYEERVLVLVFLRCLKEGLIFQLSANNGDAGKFDDVVLVWRSEEHPEARILCVQLKHRKSGRIPDSSFLSEAPNCDFGLRKYCASYAEISESLEMDKATLVLLTNACVSDNMFELKDVDSFPGLQLLQAGGGVYRLKQNNQQVCEAVSEKPSFVEHFCLLCKQNDSNQIERDIWKELEELLGAGDLCESISDRLCKSLREWMNMRKGVCLTRTWSKWQKLVDEYVKKEVTAFKVLTTRIKYCSVEDVQHYVESCNPAWVRPPEKGTEALSATKIYQALAHQTHIMVDVKRFRELRQRILRCWGPYCRWLVIVDDDKEDNSGILDELVNEIQTERRLVIVSSKENNSFSDTCHSSDISNDSWNEWLDVNVILNGDRYKCRLRDLVAGVNNLKLLLDGQPTLVLALARLSQPLRMGQELETLPTYYIPRKLVDRYLVTDEFFSSLGLRDMCVTDRASYESLKRNIGRHSVMNLVEIRGRFLTQSQIDWPLFVLTDQLETVREEYRNWGSLNIYIFKISDERWKILPLSGVPVMTRGYKREEEKEQLEVLDTASNVVIVEGKPGVGKSMMLSHVAKQIKERDSSCWLLRINLSNFYRVLDHNESGVSAVEVILQQTLCNRDQLFKLEYAVLCHSLDNSSRMTCLVDGFDETCPKYFDKCLEVLALLSPRQGKLVVTTRPAQVRPLEARMGVFAHSLKPLRASELETFFTLHPSSASIAPMSGLNQNLRNLLRIAVVAEMFAKLSQENADVYDIVTVYEAFFQNMFRRLHEKWGDNFSAPGKAWEVDQAQKQHEEQLMLLAASHLLPSNVAPAKPTFDTDYFVKYGIVYKFVNGNPIFLHRTFAEYFLAKWCFLRAGEKKRVVAYLTAYVNMGLEFFLKSFDCWAARGRPLLEAVLSGNKDKVEALLDKGADPAERDACGRNALHLAVSHYTQRSLPLLLLLCRHSGVDGLSAEDGLLGWTPMRYAVEGRRWAAVKTLLDEGGDLSQLGDFRARVRYPVQLQAVFQQGGYRALWQQVLSLNNPSWEADAPWQSVDAQMQFAISLICTNTPREWLRVIAEKAIEEGHPTVGRIILRADPRMAGKDMRLREMAKKQKPKRGSRYPPGNAEASASASGGSSIRTSSCVTELPGGGAPLQAKAPADAAGRGRHRGSVDGDEGDIFSRQLLYGRGTGRRITRRGERGARLPVAYRADVEERGLDRATPRSRALESGSVDATDNELRFFWD